MNNRVNIKIYGAARCHKSQFYLQYFKDSPFDIVFLDVEKNSKHEEELRTLYENRKLNFPTLVINGKKLRNPRTYEIEKVLKKSKTMTITNNIKIKHNPSRKRFVLQTERGKAFISYLVQDGVYYLNHSEVPSSLRGQGIGKELVEQTFDYIVENKIKAVAVCSYIKAVRDRNPKWKDKIG